MGVRVAGGGDHILHTYIYIHIYVCVRVCRNSWSFNAIYVASAIAECTIHARDKMIVLRVNHVAYWTPLLSGIANDFRVETHGYRAGWVQGTRG